MLNSPARASRCRLITSASRAGVQSLERRLLLATHTVTNLADSGPGSLAHSIFVSVAGDTVDFAPGLAGTITLTSGAISINHSLTISGPGTDKIAVSGNDQTPAFLITRGAEATQIPGDVAISGLSIVHGRNRGIAGLQALGGAIAAYDGNLKLSNVSISDSHAFSTGNDPAAGGAVYFVARGKNALSIDHSTFTNNSAVGGDSGGFAAGGAVAVVLPADQLGSAGGDTTIEFSTFVGNEAHGGDGGTVGTRDLLGPSYQQVGSAIGGAVANLGTSLYLFDSTITDNHAIAGSGGSIAQADTNSVIQRYLANTAVGGGVAALGTTISASVVRSDFSSNSAEGGDGGSGTGTGGYVGSYVGSGLGGGLVFGENGTLQVVFSRFSSNDAIGGDNNRGIQTGGFLPMVGNGRGGGVYVYSGFSGRFSVTGGTVMTGNHAAGGNGGSTRLTSDAASPIAGQTVLPGLLNEAVGGGFAIDAVGGIGVINNSTLTGNTAVGGKGGSGIGAGWARGGGVAGAPGIDTRLRIGSATIAGNSATGADGVTGADYGGGAGRGGNAYGGGVYGGSDVMRGSTISGNLAAGGRGAIGARDGDADGGGLHVGGTPYEGMTIDSNIARAGFAGTNGGTAGTSRGGGVYGALNSISSSTISNNAADQGGGMFNLRGDLPITNSTFYGNSARKGGGLFLASDALSETEFFTQLTLKDSTLAFNRSDANQGGSVWNNSAGNTAALTNNILSSSFSNDWGGSPIASGDHNLIADGTGGLSGANNLLGTAANPINPLLGTLGLYGGTTKTLPLLPGSPAINTGSSTSATDQRGITRPQQSIADIGAFESRGFRVSIESGNAQSTLVNTPFANPLVLRIVANDPSEPTAGGIARFTVPASGASAVGSSNVASIFSDGASYEVAANGVAGTYSVAVDVAGANSLTFTLTNLPEETETTLTAEDDAATTTPDKSVTVDVLANDSSSDESDTLRLLAIVSGPTNGTAKIVNGKIVYTPAFGFHDTDAIVYRVGNDDGLTETATLRITVGSGVGVAKDPLNPSRTALDIVGTSGADNISIKPARGNKVAVFFGSKQIGTYSVNGLIAVFGLGGNDTITVDGAIKLDAFVSAGSGNDTVSAGGGNDLVLGDAGNDLLKGNAGRDVLIGGDGADKLEGGAGEDLLAAGGFRSTPTLSQYVSIQREWSRTDRNYAMRRSNLTNGGGFNTIRLNAGTLFSSASLKDTLTGGSDTDLFFAAQPGDLIADKSSNETVINTK